jgi:hypothetical protein
MMRLRTRLIHPLLASMTYGATAASVVNARSSKQFMITSGRQDCKRRHARLMPVCNRLLIGGRLSPAVLSLTLVPDWPDQFAASLEPWQVPPRPIAKRQAAMAAARPGGQPVHSHEMQLSLQ